jgi:hypothetical protein
VDCLVSSGLICRQQLEEKFLNILLDQRIPEEVNSQALSLMLAARQRIPDPVQFMRKLVSTPSGE